MHLKHLPNSHTTAQTPADFKMPFFSPLQSYLCLGAVIRLESQVGGLLWECMTPPGSLSRSIVPQPLMNSADRSDLDGDHLHLPDITHKRRLGIPVDYSPPKH